MRNSLTTNFIKTARDCEKMDTGKFLGKKKKKCLVDKQNHQKGKS